MIRVRISRPTDGWCPELVQLYLDGKLDVEPFISHRIGLTDVNEAFALMERQDGIRSVIELA